MTRALLANSHRTKWERLARLVVSFVLLAGVLATGARWPVAVTGDENASASELGVMLERAEQAIREGRADLAVPLLQRVLDEGRDLLDDPTRVEDQAAQSPPRPITVVTPLRDRALRVLRRPDSSLRQAYRLAHEGAARALLSAKSEMGSDRAAESLTEEALVTRADDAALEDVVRRYRFTRIGEESAWELAGRALDQHDFVAARILLEDLASSGSDLLTRGMRTERKSSRQFEARWAVALAHSGSPEDALRIIDRWEKDNAAATGTNEALAASKQTPQIAAYVRERMAYRAEAAGAAAPAGRLDGPTTTRAWSAELRSAAHPSAADWRAMAWMAPPGRADSNATRSLKLTTPNSYGVAYDELFPALGVTPLGRRAMQAGRYPIATPLARDGVWWEKRLDELVAVDSQGAIVARSPHRFEYPAPAGWSADAVELPGRRPPFPATRWEAVYYCDEVHQSLTLIDQTLLSIEGAILPREPATAVASDAGDATKRGLPIGTARWLAGRARTNELVAYDAASLEVRWRRRAGDDELPRPDSCFVGTPVVHRDLILTPVVDGSSLLLAAFVRENGATVWRTHLADEPRVPRSLWAGVRVLCAGRQALVVTGTKRVVALDAQSGFIQWVANYPSWAAASSTESTESKSAAQRAATVATTAPGTSTVRGEPEEWQSNRAFVTDDLLIFAASDSDMLWALDRTDGRLRWSTPRQLPLGGAATELVGLVDRRVLVAGNDFIRGYEVNSGRLAWYTPVGQRSGRPVLVERSAMRHDADVADCVVLLQRDRQSELVFVDSKRGLIRRRELVKRTTPEPLGNLHSHQGRWFAGGGFNRWELVPVDRAANISAAQREQGESAAVDLFSVDEWRSASVPRKSSPAPSMESKPTAGFLVSDAAQDRVVELDLQGRITKSWDHVGTPGACTVADDGRRWVVVHQPLELLEIVPRDGEMDRRAHPLPARPASVEALAAGHLLFTFPAQQAVAERSPDGRWAWRVRVPGRPVDARRLPNGRTLVALLDDRRLVELDSDGQIAWESGEIPQPRWTQRLPQGHTLVTSWGGAQLLEFAENGRDVVWSRIAMRPYYAAVRLLDQQTLIADASGLQLITREGQSAWKLDGVGATGLAVIPRAAP